MEYQIVIRMNGHLSTQSEPYVQNLIIGTMGNSGKGAGEGMPCHDLEKLPTINLTPHPISYQIDSFAFTPAPVTALRTTVSTGETLVLKGVPSGSSS